MIILPSNLPPIGVKSDRCWVCNNFLLDSGGDPSRIRQEHHVIPQAYGGTDGPTVSLDSAHHNLLHLVATKMIAGNPWEHLLQGMHPTHKERVYYLATRVVVASSYAADDPNKRVSIVISVNKAQNEKLKQLASTMNCSKADMLLKLAEIEYNRRFQPRTNRG